ncbi:hypothetical protein N7537_004611 [Penicillium hordei]|jgi:hypothetical protein|uniref:Uncharacterized protein n=1 Tax=Penicillium hordei TaxID=40994 RepID=A0AAD6H7C4_9EURO|nr:uncharacterized protein N7537_004611 [Penicillium hordei]KAJ5607992.1 hypothetical protein N7537_004611 [Penicillium hordei]
MGTFQMKKTARKTNAVGRGGDIKPSWNPKGMAPVSECWSFQNGYQQKGDPRYSKQDVVNCAARDVLPVRMAMSSSAPQMSR